MIEAARLAGILDELDGVPLYLKLQVGRAIRSTPVVVDAAEAEPYASSALAVLNESAEDVYRGLKLAAGVAGTARYHIAVQLPGGRLRRLRSALGKARCTRCAADTRRTSSLPCPQAPPSAASAHRPPWRCIALSLLKSLRPRGW